VVYRHIKAEKPQVVLHDVEADLVQADIDKFVSAKLQNISISRSDVEILVKTSGKLFIYASTMVKYISEFPGLAHSRLKKVLSLMHTPDQHQTQGLDDLYKNILESAIPFGKLSPDEQEEYLNIVHTSISVGRPVSCSVISKLLQLPLKQVEDTISNLQSVLYVAGQDQSIYTFHASFPDYILTQKRANDMYCDPLKHHTLLTNACLHLMMEQLKFNICDLPSSFLLDNKVPGLKETIQERIDDGLQYSCNYWGYHLSGSGLNEDIMHNLERFIGEKGIFWIEAMNLLGRLLWCIEILDSLLLKVCIYMEKILK
jgi:hypothetical protein